MSVSSVATEESAVTFHRSDGCLRCLIDLLAPATTLLGVIRLPSDAVKNSSSESSELPEPKFLPLLCLGGSGAHPHHLIHLKSYL